MKKFKFWALAGTMALLMTLSSAGTVSAVAAENKDEVQPVNLENVTAKEVIVEGGTDGVLRVNGGNIDKISILAPQVDAFDYEKIKELLDAGIPAEDVAEMHRNYLEEKERLNISKPTLRLAGGAEINEVVVSGGATLNLAGGTVTDVYVKNEDNSDRQVVTIQNYSGRVTVEQKPNTDGSNNVINIHLENSNLSELNVAGEENCVFYVEGDEKSKVEAISVEGATAVTMDVNAVEVKVAETAEKSSVRIYSDVENMVVEADNSSVHVAGSAKVANAKVEGDNVKVGYIGIIENSEVTGTGSEIVYAPLPTATPLPTPTPLPTGEIIGDKNCGTGWWSAFSDTVKVEVGTTEKISFYNFTNGEENWFNFVAILQNVADAHNTGDNAAYAEYAVVRADNFGWGVGYEGKAVLSSNWNWATFRSDMDGAFVELTVTNNGTTADIVANVKTTAGKSYYQKYTGIAITGDLYYCLSTEKGYLIIPETEKPDAPEVTPDAPEVTPDPTKAPEVPEGAVVIGNVDLTTKFWTTHSDTVKVESGKTEKVTFKNYTNGETNWNNFYVVLQNVADVHNADVIKEYEEYAVLRSDNYGWGTGYGVATPECNYVWETYTNDMYGATVEVSITNNGTTADVVANVTTAEGKTYFQKYTGIAVTGDVYYCLTVEGGCLVLEKEAEEVPEVTPDPTPEVTPEPTPEVTPDPTPEVTPEPETPEEEEEYEIPAGTVIGSTNLDTGWWTVWSEGVKVKAGESKTVTFKNYTKGEGNWQNYVVILKNVPGFEDGYSEYAVARPDNYGWLYALNTGANYDELGWTLENNWDWSNEGAVFRAAMNGATVQLTITNHGTTADVLANITTVDGKEYYQNFKGIKVAGDEIYYCLSVEAAYLVIE